jgi:hypothetical protein
MHEQRTLMIKGEGERTYLENPSKWSIAHFFGLVVAFFFQATSKSVYLTLENN